MRYIILGVTDELYEKIHKYDWKEIVDGYSEMIWVRYSLLATTPLNYYHWYVFMHFHVGKRLVHSHFCSNSQDYHLNVQRTEDSWTIKIILTCRISFVNPFQFQLNTYENMK